MAPLPKCKKLRQTVKASDAFLHHFPVFPISANTTATLPEDRTQSPGGARHSMRAANMLRSPFTLRWRARSDAPHLCEPSKSNPQSVLRVSAMARAILLVKLVLSEIVFR